VSWKFTTPTDGSSHLLSTPLTVGPSGTSNDPLVVTLADEATMGISAPLACAGAYFLMPALAGITATGGSSVVTASPITDDWTS
jgi:hypothetical protein